MEYKNRPQMPADTEVRRYLHLWPVVQLLRDGKLRLTLVDHLREKYDPFEGSIPNQMMDDRVPLFSSSYTQMVTEVAAHHQGAMDVGRPSRVDPHMAATERNLQKLLSAHVSCWTHGDDSEGMWRLYCNDDGVRGRGIAIKTRLASLEDSVRQYDLAVSPITYRYYDERDRSVFTDELDVFMHKRKGFEHEREVRLLRFDQKYYFSLLRDWRTQELPNPPPAPLSVHRFMDWRADEVIEEITISPYADNGYEGVVREAIAWVAPKLVHIVKNSRLDPRYFPARY
jgi:hypothetical protein